MPSGSECQWCTERSRTIETARPSTLLRLLTRQQQKPRRAEPRRAGRWRIRPPGYTKGLYQFGRPRRRRHPKNIHFRWTDARTDLLRTGSDGSEAEAGCPFGASPCPLPPSAPGRIPPPSRRILAESHHHRRVSPAPPDVCWPSGVYREKEIPNTWVPRRAVCSFPQPPGERRSLRSVPWHVVRTPFAQPVDYASATTNGEIVPADPPRAVLRWVRGPGKAASLPRVQDPGAYSPPGWPVKTGQ